MEQPVHSHDPPKSRYPTYGGDACPRCLRGEWLKTDLGWVCWTCLATVQEREGVDFETAVGLYFHWEGGDKHEQ